jgi:hypothetical protein
MQASHATVKDAVNIMKVFDISVSNINPPKLGLPSNKIIPNLADKL